MTYNGETTVETKHLTYNDKLDIIIQALTELTEKIDSVSEQNDELAEKLSNLTVSGNGFSEDEYDS